MFSFLIELRLVTDGRPDGQTQIHSIYRASIALRGKNRAWSAPEKIKYVKTKQNNACSISHFLKFSYVTNFSVCETRIWWKLQTISKAPFTRYNLLSNRPVVSCMQTFNRLSNPFDNRYDNRLYRVYVRTTGWMFVYTIQPVVKPVVQPVWQPVVSCTRGITITNSNESWARMNDCVSLLHL